MTPDGQQSTQEFFRRALERAGIEESRKLEGLREAAALLAALHRIFPIVQKTLPQIRHSLTLRPEGLTLTIWRNGKWHDFYLDESDLAKPGDLLAHDITVMIKRGEE